MNPPYYSIVVPAYNEEALLASTLRRLNLIKAELQGDFAGELLVVDNNSTDATAAIAAEHGARVVFEPVNCIARARNSGAKSALGQALIFVDADTLACTELIRSALDALKSGTVCGGGTTVSFDAERIPLVLRAFSWLWHFHIRFFPLAAGSFVYCLRQAWEDVGGFDETIYASEEIWFSRALRKWGRKRKMAFRILGVPVVTSARKMKQFSTWHMFFMLLLIMAYPPGIKSRRICHMWYQREESR